MLPGHPPTHHLKKAPISYVGRFAPSPSGPLHFGSLVCALASFLHAKQAQGKWLVRIEDIDTPRVDDNMTPLILSTLLAHGLQWDNEIVYQSQRHSLYQGIIDTLTDTQSLYACACSRKQIRTRAEYYDGHCRALNLPLKALAIRWKNQAQNQHFCDLHYGKLTIENSVVKEDPVLRRADGIYTYHLAVIADDIDQGVTHVVRGADLLETTPLHLSLLSALNARAPEYLHIPLAVSSPGHKLSKQQLAPPLVNEQALNNLKSALVFLGLQASQLVGIEDVNALIKWAITHWRPEFLSSQTEILVSQTNGVYYIENET